MKKIVLEAILVLSGPVAFSQGWIYFDNYGGNGSPIAPVYGPESANPNEQKWGNAADANPPGMQIYSGVPLAGSGYSVEAWYSLTPVSDVYVFNSAASEVPSSLTTFYLGGGFFDAGSLVVPSSTYNNGFGVYLQVLAWDNVDGQYSTWDEAWNAALAGSGNAVGWSKVFWQPVAMGASPPAGLYNFESFNIFIVPEPSTFALFGLCGLSLWLFRRRK